MSNSVKTSGSGSLRIRIEEAGGGLEPVRGLEPHVEPADHVLRSAQVLRAALDEPSLAEIGPLRPHGHGVAQRHVHRSDHVGAIHVAGGHPYVAAEILQFRLLGEDADRAAGGVPPEEGSLRPAQDLDPVDVEHQKDGTARARHEDPVDVQAHPALADRSAPARDATDGEARDGPAVSARRRDVEVGSERSEIGEVVDPFGGDDLVGHGDDRERCVLQVRGAALGGDDDVLAEPRRLLRGLGLNLRHCWCCQGASRHAREHCRPSAQNRHPVPLLFCFSRPSIRLTPSNATCLSESTK
nr:hypothetical protein [Croceibacterium soli]